MMTVAMTELVEGMKIVNRGFGLTDHDKMIMADFKDRFRREVIEGDRKIPGVEGEKPE